MEPINLSYWNKTNQKATYPKLENNIEVDTLIIGSGITGITSAYSLALKGRKAVVIEAGDLCDGTTGNTTGKLTIQHDIIYSNIIKKYGEEFAKEYVESQSKAIGFIRDVVKKEAIDCNLANSTAYIFGETEKEINDLKKEYETALKLGIDAEYIDNPNFPPNNMGMLAFKNQAVFHPTRYINGLAEAATSKGAKIYCSTKAIKIEPGDIITITCENDIVIKAKHLIMATQYPIYDGFNLFYARLYAKRAYGVAVEARREWPDGSYINVGNPTRSIRTHVEDGKKILIVVGESHATGREEDKKDEHFDNLIKFADDIAGIENVLATWSAQDYDTPDQIPYIGRLSKNSNIFVVSGYKKWGLTTGTLAGNIITDLIVNDDSPYEKLYSTSRADFLTSMGKVMTEVFSFVGELIKSKFEGNEDLIDLKQGEGRVIKYDGQKAGIYRDYDDNITILDITCTHMLSELHFNPLEKTWDCPTHGGRYAVDGKLLEGPPKNPLKVLYTGTFEELKKDYDM
ncbi:MAG: FAD-dependent oxidoreductase [Bacilli bacterium]|nr:FAD-dependent oxidoreductase [Bacilli bacterium]